MPYATTGYWNRDPAEARSYSLARDGADYPLSINFTLGEFAQSSTDRLLLHPALIAALQRLRTRFGTCSVTSAYRTAAHNEAVGGADGSYHILGMAADVVFPQYADGRGIASYARDVLGMCVGLRPSGALHLSVGAEGGADRTIVEAGRYVQFPNLYPGGEDREGGFAGGSPGGGPDGAPAVPPGGTPFRPAARLAGLGGGVLGMAALAAVALAALQQPGGLRALLRAGDGPPRTR